MVTKKTVSQKYKLLEIIGRGKFGTVHKGVDVDTKQIIAIKILNLDTDHEEVKDIQQEIQFLSNLKSAPNITHYYGSYLNGHKLWILMDYCAGGSVRTLLKPGPLNEKYISIITRELLIALQFIHENGVIHRDIKAANILISKEGKVKLCDFGVAAQLTSTALKRTTMAGTPYWMAPEVITEGATYNSKADIWSAGITIYEMATGNPPYSDKDALRAMQFITQHEPPRLEGRQYGPLLKEMIAICLEEKQDLRPSAEELLKSKFIKASKTFSTVVLKEVVGKYLIWRDNRSTSNINVINESSDQNSDHAMFKNDNDNNGNNNNQNGNNANLKNNLTNHPMSSAVSISESSLSLEDGENIKWDFDSLKSAEYIIENDININQNEENDKYDDFYYETNNNTNRDFTTSPYNRTFTIGNTMINNVISENKNKLTATATQIDSIINSPIEPTFKKEPPKYLLQLFQNDSIDDDYNHNINHSNNISTIINNESIEKDNFKFDLSITIPTPQQSQEILPTPIQMRKQITSPLIPIEIPNMDIIENEIQEREKQRSRAATLNVNSLNINNTKVESLISDQPLPIRKPTLTISNRTPSPAKALEQINTNLQSSPSKQTSPLHMKPLPLNISQPLLQPLNGSNKVKAHMNLSNISTHKNLMNNGPQTAPISNTSNSDMLDSSIRARSQMRIQMPVPVSATSSAFPNVLMKDNLLNSKSSLNIQTNANNNNDNTEKNQFGFDVNAASSLPLAMTPVTERPHPPVVTPERDVNKSENSHPNFNNNFSQSSVKLFQYATLSNTNNVSNTMERKMSFESNLKNQAHSQSYINFTVENRNRNNSFISNSDDNEKADVTLTNENTSILTNIDDSVVTGLGMMTMSENGKVSPFKINHSCPSFGSNNNDSLISSKMFKILNNSQMSMNKVTNVGLGLVSDFNDSDNHGFYINELDGLLGNMNDLLEIVISELK
jgi:protein-serine/threonine kinase